MEESSTSRPDGSRRVYEIRVRGALDDEWAGRLRDMRIEVDRSPSGPLTDLSGELPDEAALNGVLTTLYSLGMTLVSVGRAPEITPRIEAVPTPKK